MRCRSGTEASIARSGAGHGLPFAGVDTLLERMRTRQALRPDRSTLGDDMTPASLPTGRLAHEPMLDGVARDWPVAARTVHAAGIFPSDGPPD